MHQCFYVPKVFNDEEEFGIIPDNPLYENRIQGENDSVMIFRIGRPFSSGPTTIRPNRFPLYRPN
ncbi:hypothetical protein HMPREF1989_01743 [Porphyromonas gingivalis F0566]|nr:hypothetical protein HMPREF1989_01743 [Porphyromonas gingivalis F0566]